MTSDKLLPLRGPAKRREFAVVDIESKDGDTQKAGFTRPFLVGFYDGLNYLEFRGDDCIARSLDYLLLAKNDGLTYYAHFGGSFDWLHFLPCIVGRGLHFEIATVQSKIQAVRVKPSKASKRKGWTFLDSGQLIPVALKKAGKSLEVEVLKVEFDLDTIETDVRWSEYLQADCVSLYQVLVKFYNLIEKLGGEVGITLASTAMKTYRRAYQEAPIDRHVEHADFFREAYYGGRVEVFKKTGENLSYFDLNSSYPASMLENMPTGELTEFDGEPSEWVFESGRIGFAEVSVNVPVDTYIPVLPVRDDNHRLIFPTGTFTGTWAWDEIKEAVANGAKITRWGKSVWIRESKPFVKMVETLYEFRNEDAPNYSEALSFTAKILLNSLYGKFATNPERECVIYVPLEQQDEVFESLRKEREAKGEKLEIKALEPKNPEGCLFSVNNNLAADYIVPQLAAQVTALSRIRLHRALVKAHATGLLCYCDTDSVVTSGELDNVGGKIGQWKDVGKGVKYTGEFIQPKLYMLSGDDGSYNVTMKGFRTRTPESFAAAKRGETLEFESIERIGAMIRKGLISGPQKVILKRTIKNETSFKRKPLADGSSIPLQLLDGKKV